MQVKKTQPNPTSIKLSITLNEADLQPVKQLAVQKLGQQVKLQGFRPGKAPAALVEKSIDQNALQSEVLEEAINHFYIAILTKEALRPVAQPTVSIKKFVPFTTLEYDTETDIIGEIVLPDYKKIKLAAPTVEVTAMDVTDVLKSLQQRLATRTDVERPAKDGDQATIDFKGVDEKGTPISGADGKDYPLVLGSNSFIPGFEDNVTGLKSGDNKTFDLTFPKDYGVKALAGKKVTFTVDVKAVQELKQPALDDDFAAQAGPFKTLKDLKADIKTQLVAERQQDAQRNYENELLELITNKSTVAIPESLVDEQLDVAEREERQNLMYRGQTWEEHLKEEGVTEEEHRQRNRETAASRVKAGLVLSEISTQEKLEVTPEELAVRIEALKGQYQDQAMRAELDKPENQRDIAMRILSEKTIATLVKSAQKK